MQEILLDEKLNSFVLCLLAYYKALAQKPYVPQPVVPLLMPASFRLHFKTGWRLKEGECQEAVSLPCST